MTATSRDDRLNRLAGSGRGSGGGLPLPALFAAMLNEVLDSAPVTAERMTEIASSVLSFKRQAVFATWPDGWEGLAADVLAQMESKDLIRREGGSYVRGDALVTGKLLEVIPPRSRKASKSDGVMVWDKAERTERSRAAHVERDATSLIANPRPVDRTHVQEIRESLTEVGRLYPVLTDKQGRLLDGRHRRAADPNWPSQPARRADGTVVSTEAEALAVIRATGLGAPLPPATVKDIDRLLGEMAKSGHIKRDRIGDLLREDASQSNRAIAAELGVDDKTVASVRLQLQGNAEIPHYRFSAGGKGRGRVELVHEAREGCCADPVPAPAVPASPRATSEEVKEAIISEMIARLEAGEPTDFRGAAALFGVGEAVVQTCIAVAKDRLIRQSALQPQPQPQPLPQPAAAAESGPAPVTLTPLPQSPRPRPRPVKLVQRFSHMLRRWESEQSSPESELDTSAELEQAEALRQELDEWIAELRRR